MKRFFDIKYNGQAYDALGRRKGQDLFYILGGNKVAIGGASAGPNAANKAPTKIAAKPTGSTPSAGTKAPVTSSKPVASKTVGKASAESSDVAKL
jgi:hypothetical protein